MRARVRTLLDYIERLNLFAGSLAGACVILFILTIIPDALTRSLFSYAFQGVSEFNILTLVVLVFLGLASAQCRKENFQVRILIDHAPVFLARAIGIFALVVQALISGLFVYLTTGRAIMSYQTGEATFSIIAFPVWPARIVIAVGFWMLTIQLLIDIVRILAPAWAPEPKRNPDEDVLASEI